MKIEFIGKFYDQHSLSIVNRNLVLKMKDDPDINLCITSLDFYDPINPLKKEDVLALKELEANSFDDADIQIRHTYPPIFRWPLSKNTKVIFIQPWEFERIPFEWQYKFEQFADALIVPSEWTAGRFIEAGLDPEKLYIVGNGYNPEVFNTKESSTDKFKSNKFTFTFVGNAQFRKGIDILISIWFKTFKRNDSVRIIFKDSPKIYGNNNTLDELLKIMYKTKCAEMIYYDDTFSEQEMADLYKATDVLVHPHRGEGFGMHIQEAMACGAVPLISDQGAPTSFVDLEKDGFGIKTDRKIIDILDQKIFAAKPGDSFTGMNQHSFVQEPNPIVLHNLLKEIYNNKDSILKDKPQNNKIKTWEQVVKELNKGLKELYTNGKESKPRRFS